MKKSDLKQIADLIDDRLDQKLGKLEQNLEKKFESIEQRFEQVDKRFDQMESNFDQKLEGTEDRIMTLVKTEVDRLDARIDEVVIELKKKPDRYEVFEWTDKRIAQLKFN